MDEKLVAAVFGVLEAGGPEVLDQPGRFRSMLADLLGQSGGSLRREQAALVGAVEQGAGRDLMSETLTADERDALVGRLESSLQLESTEVITAVDLLDNAISSVGLRSGDNGNGAGGTQLSSTVPPTAVPGPAAAPPPPPQPPPPAPATIAPATMAPAITPAAADSVTKQTVTGAAPPPFVTEPVGTPATGATRSTGRVPFIVGAIAFLVIGAIVATLVLVNRSDDSTPPAAVASLDFPTEMLPYGSLDRKWEVSDNQLNGTLTFENTGSEKSTGRYLEVIPKSLAPTASDIDSDPAPNQVVEDDPILAYDITLEPAQTLTITYRIAVPEGTDNARLEAWKEEAATARATYEATQNKKPSLVVSSPADGSVFEVPEADLVGTTDPGVTLDVNGFAIPVNSDGTWSHHTTEMAVGPNSFVFTAVAPNKQTTQQTITLTYTPPPGGSGGGVTNTTRPPRGNDPDTTPPNDGGGNDDPDSTLPPTTTNPSNAGPTVTCNPIYVNYGGQYSAYEFSVAPSCYSDPEGDQVFFFDVDVKPEWGSAEITPCNYTPNPSTGNCITFTPLNPYWSNFSAPVWISIYDPGGSGAWTGWHLVWINVP
jgi:hypothetical protein